MSPVPTITPQRRRSDTTARAGCVSGPAADTAAVVKMALDVGYRHIDTAEMYQNEQGVGVGIRDAGVDRTDVFVTSKLNNGFHKPDDARRAFDQTLAALGFDYLDLFLIHWPFRRSMTATSSRRGRRWRNSE